MRKHFLLYITRSFLAHYQSLGPTEVIKGRAQSYKHTDQQSVHALLSPSIPFPSAESSRWVSTGDNDFSVLLLQSEGAANAGCLLLTD